MILTIFNNRQQGILQRIFKVKIMKRIHNLLQKPSYGKSYRSYTIYSRSVVRPYPVVDKGQQYRIWKTSHFELAS